MPTPQAGSAAGEALPVPALALVPAGPAGALPAGADEPPAGADGSEAGIRLFACCWGIRSLCAGARGAVCTSSPMCVGRRACAPPPQGACFVAGPKRALTTILRTLREPTASPPPKPDGGAPVWPARATRVVTFGRSGARRVPARGFCAIRGGRLVTSGRSGSLCVPARRFRATRGRPPVTFRRSGSFRVPARRLLTTTRGRVVTFGRSGARGVPARGFRAIRGGRVVTSGRSGGFRVPARRLLTIHRPSTGACGAPRALG